MKTHSELRLRINDFERLTGLQVKELTIPETMWADMKTCLEGWGAHVSSGDDFIIYELADRQVMLWRERDDEVKP